MEHNTSDNYSANTSRGFLLELRQQDTKPILEPTKSTFNHYPGARMHTIVDALSAIRDSIGLWIRSKQVIPQLVTSVAQEMTASRNVCGEPI